VGIFNARNYKGRVASNGKIFGGTRKFWKLADRRQF
jgi:hypothetical protein